MTFRVKRGSLLPVNAKRAKKQRTINVPCTRVNSEIVNTAAEEVITVKTEEVDGSNGEYCLDILDILQMCIEFEILPMRW